jgi:hypothetical protein
MKASEMKKERLNAENAESAEYAEKRAVLVHRE